METERSELRYKWRMVEIPELKELGMSKLELARQLGLHPKTVYGWKKLPEYVEAYLRLKIMMMQANWSYDGKAKNKRD